MERRKRRPGPRQNRDRRPVLPYFTALGPHCRLTLRRSAPRLSAAHRDRLRVRPFEAGATVEANHFEKVPTPAEVAVSRPPRQMSCCEAGCAFRRRRSVTATCHYGYSVGFLRCAKPVRPSGPARNWSTRSMSSLSQAGVARSATDVHAARLASPVVPATPVREGILQLDQPLTLHFGGRLDGVRVAWRVTGNPHGPAGRGTRRHLGRSAVADVGTSQKGWWCEVIGPGKALDTDRYQVLGHRLSRRQRRDAPDRAPARRTSLRSAATTRPRSCDGSSSICASHRSPQSSARPTAAWWRWRLPSAIRSS